MNTPSTVHEQWATHRPDLDTSPIEVVALVKQVSHMIEEAVGALYDSAPLTLPEMDLLVPLRHADGPVIARRLADQMNLSRAGVSKALGKLEKRGFIERTPNPADRRAAFVRITESGQDAVDAVFPRQLEIEAQMLAALGERRGAVVAALTELAEALRQHRHSPGT
ncbi:MarR family winged helix-turn-helix transcriptional regulator [Streptomyces sp. SDT5-1]|uniref:MarR family winged helix-turn-helix transcriptional regulator n=1 Tax=Streptomyces sp. SDT5-1 TaxID=3406418 RepID=UPI003FD37FE5